VFDAKLYSSSPTRRSTAPGGFGQHHFGGGGGSLPGTPEAAGAAPGPFSSQPQEASATGPSGPSAFEQQQRAGGEGIAAVTRAFSPDVLQLQGLAGSGNGGGFSPAWLSSSLAEAWDGASSDGGASRSTTSSPDRGLRGGAGAWLAWGAGGGGAGRSGGERVGGGSIDLGTLGRARRTLAASEPGFGTRSVLGSRDARAFGANSSGGGFSSGDPSTGRACTDSSSGDGGSSSDGTANSSAGTANSNASTEGGACRFSCAAGDDDAVCVVEVAMAAAVEATTRPARGGRGGKHRQKAKLNASLQQLAGRADAPAAQGYVDACLGAYKRRHAGDGAALELLTRHLAYLIGGVVRFKLEGQIPWSALPVPDPADLADKTRTPNYRSWLVRLGVVTPEAFGRDYLDGGGCESPCGAAAAALAVAVGMGMGPLA